MEIQSGINQPVNFYSKSTGNSINTVINEDNTPFSYNFFAPELSSKDTKIQQKQPSKHKRKSKRLNLNDSEYFPDEVEEIQSKQEESNIFISQQKENEIKKMLKHFAISIPLVNYFFLKKKSNEIRQTIAKLNDISQDVDDLITSPIPYGEEGNLYQDLAKNLNSAANILGQSNNLT